MTFVPYGVPGTKRNLDGGPHVLGIEGRVGK